MWLKENSLLAEAPRQNVLTVDNSRYNVDRATFSLIIDPVNINDTSTHYRCELFVTNPITGTISHPQSGQVLSLQVISKY
jgi:hypothetical protein